MLIVFDSGNGVPVISYTFGGKYKGVGDRGDFNNYDNTPGIGDFNINPRRVNAVMFDFVSSRGSCVAITPAPSTKQPTRQPTRKPTRQPTKRPAIPTKMPTAKSGKDNKQQGKSAKTAVKESVMNTAGTDMLSMKTDDSGSTGLFNLRH